MAATRSDEVMVSGSDEAECSGTMVEIKIKTLDSETYTLRVDKCVPVPALKEKIATITGVLSEQQRLICRGKVLKDDQLLSAYHVEDGHTLHLVVRQPLQASTSAPGIAGSDNVTGDPASDTARNRLGPNMVLGTFNVAEQGDGYMPDLNRIVSAVLNSIGVMGPGIEGVGVIREITPERVVQMQGSGGVGNTIQVQTDEVTPRRDHSHLPAVSSPIPPHANVIPDSLSTLSQYLSCLRHQFIGDGTFPNTIAGSFGTQNIEGQDSDGRLQLGEGLGPMPTPASLAEVMHSVREFLTEQAAGCLLQLARQLEDQRNISDSLTRMNIQSTAMRSGVLLQNLGALLLELGRTTMTLRMGRTPSEAVVNAGPAVFISRSGPNPIMVQPLPFQPGTSFGAFPSGGGHGFAGGPLGSGLPTRNIDIRIRTGPLMPNANSTSGERASGSQEHTAQVGGERAALGVQANASAGETGVRMVPLRTVVAAVPAPVNRPPDSVNGSNGVGLFYPLLARFQNLRGSEPSSEDNAQRGTAHSSSITASGVSGTGAAVHTLASRQQGPLPTPSPAEHPVNPSSGGSQNGQGSSLSRFDQLLQTIFPSPTGVNMQSGSGAANAVQEHQDVPPESAEMQDELPRNRDEVVLFSNLLRQIMPVISQSISGASETTETSPTGEFEMEGPSDVGSSDFRREPPSPPGSKRQKME